MRTMAQSVVGSMLSLCAVDKSFRSLGKSTLIADQLDLELREDRIIGLVGPSGSGKSTIGRLILDLEPPDRGSVQFDGCALAAMNREQRKNYRRAVQMVPQHPDAAFNPRRSIGASLREVFRFHPVCAKEEREDYLTQTLDHVRIHRELLARYPGQLSGGELQRLAIARAILTKPRFLILDEVTSMLDVSVQATVIQTLRELRTLHPMGYLFITHNLELAQVFCDRVLRLDQGQLQCLADRSGTP